MTHATQPMYQGMHGTYRTVMCPSHVPWDVLHNDLLKNGYFIVSHHPGENPSNTFYVLFKPS